ncbi:MAG: thiol peroxidase [Candidatus Marinimicrobia bacterium]|nr:thiol peroxidase [Candidatus Neomarinimicrobiota bacterium]
MATVTFKGAPIATVGELPAVGQPAPAFQLTRTDLSACTLAEWEGQTVVLNIFPSVDTSVCAQSVRRFNQVAVERPGTVVLCVSMDLPFAHARFCGAEGLDKVLSVSAFRSPSFGRDYGVTLAAGPLAGLFARAVVVIDGAGQVRWAAFVPEIAQEPDYDRVLAALA